MDCTVIVTHPVAFLPLQLAEEKLQLLDCDAVAGEDTQHVHEQVCVLGMSRETEKQRKKYIVQLDNAKLKIRVWSKGKKYTCIIW